MTTRILLFLITMSFATASMAQGDTIYGLHFTTGQLRFANMDINTGQVNVLSNAALSPDAFQQGVADFDPFNKVYYYVRGLGSSTQLFSVDAKTGAKIHSPTIADPNNSVVPLTNIAYNWLNDTLYGLEHVYNGSFAELSLVSVDPVSGALNVISANPIATYYLSGNSDIDPVHRKYYFVTGDRIYTLSLDNGKVKSNPTLVFPNGSSGYRSFVNLTYNWFDGQLYGLYVSPAANPSGPYISQMQLAKIDPSSGKITVISNNPLSLDGYSMGDCDIDPVGNRYFYIRQNSLYSVDLTTGNTLSVQSISNSTNAVAPIINMSYDDLKISPAQPIPMSMGSDTLIIDFANGETIVLNAFVGNSNVNYTWQDNSTQFLYYVTQPGDYHVNIDRNGFQIEGNVVIIQKSVNTNIGKTVQSSDIEIYPNPVNDFIHYQMSDNVDLQQIRLFNTSGQLILEQNAIPNIGQIGVTDLNAGLYILEFRFENSVVTKKVMIR